MTIEKDIRQLLAELMTSCGLGAITSPIEAVSGGYMHRMYRVATNCGTYAVKHLNPKVMARPDAQESYAQAEKIEGILEKEDIPIIPSLTIYGNKMQPIKGHFFYIFNWKEGHITDWNHISNRQCYIAGNLLGRIHAVKSETVSPQTPEMTRIDWHGYTVTAKKQRCELAPLLEENEKILLYAVAELNRAKASLPDFLCLSNGDMDPKNVIWDNGNPWVIDLECLNYDNPVSHALQLALQWSGVVACDISINKIASYFDGYLEAYDNYFRSYSDVFGLAYTWVEWLEYSIQRALGNCMDEAERTMGISETKNTLRRIRYLYGMEKELKAALDSLLLQRR